MISLPGFWQRHFLGVELCIVIIATSAVAIWVFSFNGAAFVEEIPKGNRSDIYRTVAIAAISLLGFCLTVISIVLGFVSQGRLAVLRSSKHHLTLWKTFFAAVKSSGMLSAIALICLVFDKDDKPILWLEVLFFFFSILCAARLFRVVWALERIVWLLARPSPSDEIPS